MKLLTYKVRGEERLGVLSQDGSTIYDLRDADVSFFNMNDLVSRMTTDDKLKIEAFLECPEGGVPYEQAEKCAPIPRPAQDIVCLGQNFAKHREESMRYKKEAFGTDAPVSVYFSKRVNEALPDGGVIPAHGDVTERLDYESELLVVIGREAKAVSVEDAYDYVFGYTIMNDVSARDIQTAHKQWYFGKSLDGFVPMGPWIVTADELPGRPEIQVQSYVNGELRQDGNTRDLMFDIAYVIHELSAGMTLLPGTLIAMGTPAGVGMGFTPPKFLKAGDVVECRIEGIGSLTNPIG